jgi:hypothetical protein
MSLKQKQDLYIRQKILTIRNTQVMLDSDLAVLYNVETRVLNQAVKRNIKRFPKEFMFQLTKKEFDHLKLSYFFPDGTLSQDKKEITTLQKNYENPNLKSQIVTSSSKHGGRRKLPYVFTEQGISMLSAVLKSDIAIEVSIKIINAFVEMRRFITNNTLIYQKFSYFERKLIEHDENIEKIFKVLERGNQKPKKGIYFEGQIFDAYIFISDLIKSAKRSIILIDNFIDETTLLLFSKNQNVDTTIYTKNISKQLQLDLKKYNAQYKPIEIIKFDLSHDRFLIIDHQEIYHIGASLKDLGKKWFAFSKFETNTIDILNKLIK